MFDFFLWQLNNLIDALFQIFQAILQLHQVLYHQWSLPATLVIFMGLSSGILTSSSLTFATFEKPLSAPQLEGP